MPDPITLGVSAPLLALAESGAGKALLSGGIGAAGSILGGLISSDKNAAQMEANRNMQEYYLQHGIKHKVKDAMEAGIHPLYALGAQTNMPSPMMIGDTMGPALAEAGQNISNAVNRILSREERMAISIDLDNKLSQSRKNYAEAAYLENETMRKAIDFQQSPGGLGIQPEGGVRSDSGQNPNPPGVGMVNVKAVDQPSMKRGSPGVQSGTYEAFQQIRTGPDFFVRFPALEGESWMEHWGEMGVVDKIAFINQNAGVYGNTWPEDFWRVYFEGKPPLHKYKPIEEIPGGRTTNDPTWVDKFSRERFKEFFGTKWHKSLKFPWDK